MIEVRPVAVRVVVLAALVALTCSLQTAPAQSASTQDRWARSFKQLKLSGSAGVVVTGLNRPDATVIVGGVPANDAWSTAKIPLSIAALRRSGSATTKARVERALRYSDNAAADQLWSELGRGTTAARRVDAVFRSYGDTITRTQANPSPGRSAFGRTQWLLSSQSRFMARLACNREGAFLRAQLQRTTSGHWGLMTFDRPLSKNGYGPTRGKYLVRQTAIIVGSDKRRWGVSISVLAPSLSAGQRDLTRIATWMRTQVRLQEIPAHHCPL